MLFWDVVEAAGSGTGGGTAFRLMDTDSVLCIGDKENGCANKSPGTTTPGMPATPVLENEEDDDAESDFKNFGFEGAHSLNDLLGLSWAPSPQGSRLAFPRESLSFGGIQETNEEALQETRSKRASQEFEPAFIVTTQEELNDADDLFLPQGSLPLLYAPSPTRASVTTASIGIDKTSRVLSMSSQRLDLQSPACSSDFGVLRARVRRPPQRMLANDWARRGLDTRSAPKKRKMMDARPSEKVKSDKGMKEEETLKPAPLQDTFGGFDTSAIEAQEEAIGRQYASKGLKIHLFMKTSVVNKKVDVFLRKFLKFFSNGGAQKTLRHHVITIEGIRSNGEGTKMSSSNIFGRPLALHVTVTQRNGLASKEKLVLRFYKEHLDCDKDSSTFDSQSASRVGYLVQVNAGGVWQDDEGLAMLLADIFSAAGYHTRCQDVRARTESSVFSVTNRETFHLMKENRPVSVDISALAIKFRAAGLKDVKVLHVTGGLSLQLDDPKCKPQIQKTGTIYMPFCSDPRRVRLALLYLILPFAEDVLEVPKATTKQKRQ